MQNSVTKYVISFNVLGIRFRVECFSEIDRDWLQYILRDYISDDDRNIPVCVIIPDAGQGGYMRNHLNNLDVKDLVVEKGDGQRELWNHFHTPIPPFLVEPYVGKYLLLHGCGVCSQDGKTTLIIGDSMSGKTYLTLRLLQESYKLVTDDLVVFDYDNELLLPYSKPIGLRENSIRIDEKLNKYVCDDSKYKLEFTANDGKKTWLVHANDIFENSLYYGKCRTVERVIFLDNNTDDIKMICFGEAIKRVCNSVIESGLSNSKAMIFLAKYFGRTKDFVSAPIRKSDMIAEFILRKDNNV